jgi:hypothetical protein
MIVIIRLAAYSSDVAVDFYYLTTSRLRAFTRREAQDGGAPPAFSSLYPLLEWRLGKTRE